MPLLISLCFLYSSQAVSFVSCDSYVFFFQAEDGIRYLVRSRGLGDVYKSQKLPIKIGLLILAAIAAGVLWQQEQLAALALVHVLSLIHI